MIKDQSIFSELRIILLNLITFSFDNVLVLFGENWCWSLLGLKGLMWNEAAKGRANERQICPCFRLIFVDN